MRKIPTVMAIWMFEELAESRIATGKSLGKGSRPSKDRQLSIGMGSMWSFEGWDQTVFLCMDWHLGVHSLQRNT